MIISYILQIVIIKMIDLKVKIYIIIKKRK